MDFGSGTRRFTHCAPADFSPHLRRYIQKVIHDYGVELSAGITDDFASRFAVMRERVEAMRAIWTKSKPEYHGKFVEFPPMMTWPKPVQKPHPPVILGGAFPWAARRAVRYGDGWYPNASSGDPFDYLPRFRQMAEDAGRDPQSLEVTLGGAPEDPDMLKRYRDLGVSRVNFPVPPAKADEVLPILDRIAKLMRPLQA